LILVAVLTALWFTPKIQSAGISDATKRVEVEDTIRKTWVNLALGIVGFLALYFQYRRVLASDRQSALTEQGQVTDRFTKSVEQLGKTESSLPNLEVRIGAIHALERIAADSERDRRAIVEVSQYLRRNAAYAETCAARDMPLQEDWDWRNPKPRADIQVCITALGRLRVKEILPTDECLDLSECDLRNVKARSASFEGASFTGSNMDGVRLHSAQLIATSYHSVSAQHASFIHSTLSRAAFPQCQLSMANFYGADCERATFTGAICIRTSFNLTRLRGAHFLGCDLRNATFDQADLTSVKFTHCDLRGVDLRSVVGLDSLQFNNCQLDESPTPHQEIVETDEKADS
jgi:uncharacterized protein YjbI with pentapeptide repeats